MFALYRPIYALKWKTHNLTHKRFFRDDDDIQFSSQVIMFSINSGSSSNLSKNLSRCVDGWAFGQGANFLGPTSHRLSTCSICYVKFVVRSFCRPFQSQQSFKCSYADLRAQFHWFSNLESWNRDRLTWTLVIFGALSDFRKPLTPFENTCTM